MMYFRPKPEPGTLAELRGAVARVALVARRRGVRPSQVPPVHRPGQPGSSPAR